MPPSSPDPPDVTQLMVSAAGGDKAAADSLRPLVYAQLRKAAQRDLARESPGNTLSATALVHEAYLILIGPREVAWANRAHFYAAAAESMRRILLDPKLAEDLVLSHRYSAAAAAVLAAAALPAEERNAFRQLWSDVDTLLTKASRP